MKVIVVVVVVVQNLPESSDSAHLRPWRLLGPISHSWRLPRTLGKTYLKAVIWALLGLAAPWADFLFPGALPLWQPLEINLGVSI